MTRKTTECELNPKQRVERNRVRLLKSQREVREVNRKQWECESGGLVEAHGIAFGALSSLLQIHFRESLPSEIAAESVSNEFDVIDGRLPLFASFVQGIEFCETAVSEALYVQASNLLKQEMETVAAVIEYRKAKRKNMKAANVKNLPWGLSQHFGPMNNVAHIVDRATLSGIMLLDGPESY